MGKRTLLLAIASALLFSVTANHKAKLVIGGYESTPRFIPYITGIISDSGFFCGGSLISTKVVLTAAHCTYGNKYYLLYLGSVDLNAYERGRQTAKSHDARLHQHYNDSTLENDVAVIFLQDAVIFSPYVRAVKLAEADSGSFVNQQVMVSGWGRTTEVAEGEASSVLHYTYLTVVSNEECTKVYTDINDAATICAKSSRNTSTCDGDSGGPMLARVHGNTYNLLVGITSFAHKKGCTTYPTGYTKVSYYRNWTRRTSGV